MPTALIETKGFAKTFHARKGMVEAARGAAGQPIATVVDLNRLWTINNVDEICAAEIQSGQTVDIVISPANQPFRGQVIFSAKADYTAMNTQG